MTVGDKAKHAAQNLKGKAKETTGTVTGNDEVRAEGQADQDEARAKQTADKAKDTVQNAGQVPRPELPFARRTEETPWMGSCS